MAKFAIVHGAWGGAWAWNQLVVPALRKAGHDVYPVTLTGLGERVHLSGPDVDLDTHVQDVVNTLFYEDLHDVILAGHSYGGMVITGVADRCPERLQQLVYLDASVPTDGMALVDQMPGRREKIMEGVGRDADGWRVEPGDVPPDQPAAITDWARPRRVAMPYKTMTQPLTLTRGETSLPRAYVYCTVGKPAGGYSEARAARVKNDPRWRYFELETGHNLHYTAPNETVEILLKLAAGD